MRQFWGVSEEAFLKSFEFDNLKAVRGEGKSGAFFIFTKDRQFVLKTATGEERDFLWNILPYYYQYIRRNPNSLLPRFYGVYSMKHDGIGGMTRFVVMNNIFNTPYAPVEKCAFNRTPASILSSSFRFDLKGSTVGRFVKESKRTPGVILKDLDITEMGRKLFLPENLRDEFVRQLKKDSDVRTSPSFPPYHPSSLPPIRSWTTASSWASIMRRRRTRPSQPQTSRPCKRTRASSSPSYQPPLLLTIHLRTWMKNDFQKHHNGIKTVRPDGVTEIYYIGIIDILIQFEVKKKLEHLVKSIAYSAVRPQPMKP